LSRPASLPPCVLFEDEDLLVVNKPAGLNTHSPSPHAGEGIYEWLRHREARWGALAIIHRLDKETSGVLVLAKTPRANRSLTAQFTDRTVRKTYLLLTDRPAPGRAFTARGSIVRAGERYVIQPARPGTDLAETEFAPGPDPGPAVPAPGLSCLTARPRTGRTHQIRAQAAEAGFPILGDVLYGGTPAARVCLHAEGIAFQHPATNEPAGFHAPVDFTADPRAALRAALVNQGETALWRACHGAADQEPGWYIDHLGEWLLSQHEEPLDAARLGRLAAFAQAAEARGTAHKILARHVRGATPATASPQPVTGTPPDGPFTVRENGLQFELSFAEGYSVGIFPDQRDNRRRLLTGHVAAGFDLPPRPQVLNTFAYTCGFSVAAAANGANTTSLDLSRKYLEWGRRNFALNHLDPADHEFIYGDVFDWLRRWAKKGRRFDLILLDPPTFSHSRESGVFRARQDYGRLAAASLPRLNPGGVLFASTNAADWPPEDFLAVLEAAARDAGRRIVRSHYVPQPPDFPIHRAEPAYLKTVWLQLD